MKQVFVINELSIGSKYGVGTYIDQIIRAFEGFEEWHLNVVELYSCNLENKIIEINNVTYFYIPGPPYGNDTNRNIIYKIKYYRSIYYYLSPYLSIENNLFHFNFSGGYELAKLLKSNVSCKILFTLHFTSWGFELFDDVEKLKLILSEPKSKIDEGIKFSFEKEKKFMHECCDHIIVIAKHSYEVVNKVYNVDASKISLVPNGIEDLYIKQSDEEIHRLKKSYLFDESEKLIIYAGRIDRLKGVMILIETFKLLLNNNPNVRLIIAGDGNYSRSFLTAHSIWSKITFTGFLEKKELYKLFAISDIGIVPSLYEEFGLIAVEMMMNKLPIIVAKSTGLSEIVDGKNGLLVEIRENNDEVLSELCDVINKLLTDKVIANEIANNGRSSFEKYYNLDVFKSKIRNIYIKMN